MRIAPSHDISYYHSDHIGSTSLLTDESGAVESEYTYYPFGEMFKIDGIDIHYKFTGQLRDNETALYFYNARYYDSKLGRFISPDSIVQSMQNPQFLNRYTYTLNNPVRYNDPSGHYTYDPCRNNNCGSSPPASSFRQNQNRGNACPPGGCSGWGGTSTGQTGAVVYDYGGSTRAFFRAEARIMAEARERFRREDAAFMARAEGLGGAVGMASSWASSAPAVGPQRINLESTTFTSGVPQTISGSSMTGRGLTGNGVPFPEIAHSGIIDGIQEVTSQHPFVVDNVKIPDGNGFCYRDAWSAENQINQDGNMFIGPTSIGYDGEYCGYCALPNGTITLDLTQGFNMNSASTMFIHEGMHALDLPHPTIRRAEQLYIDAFPLKK